MLPKFYRFIAVNNTGQTLTAVEGGLIALRFMPYKFGTTGALEYGTVITDDVGQAATIADTVASEGDVQDNSTNLYVGGHGTFDVTHDVDAAAGTYELYVEFCDASAGEWPSDGADFDVSIDLGGPICVLTIDNSAVDKNRVQNFVL